jgi:hypothetical protein
VPAPTPPQRRGVFAIALLALAMAAISCAKAPPVAPPKPPPPPKPTRAPIPDEDAFVPEEVDFEPKWRGASFAPYLVPKVDFAKDGGAVDVVFQFHAGMVSEKDWRAAHLKAVVISAAFGLGSAPYEDALRDPARFGRWIDEVLGKLGTSVGTPLHLRRLGVVSFSAGFGAVLKILRQGYGDKLDTLILLDSIHTSYTKERRPDVHGMAPFIDFASLAKDKKKLMVLTHSSIRPLDYASSTEAVGALLGAVGVPLVPLSGKNEHGMEQLYRADAGALHAFGFKGETAKDHMDHLGLVADMVRTYVAKRWGRMEALERRSASPDETETTTRRDPR